MRSSHPIGLGRALPLGAALVVLLAGSAGAAQDEAAARVTACVGDAASAGQALDPRASLSDGAGIETGDDGGCSMVVDQDAVMELCAGTNVRLERKAADPDGPRVVRLERGEIRVVAEPRLGEERIEVHTPAAIATILGTIVHVSVDALGVTTVTSAAAKVLVESASDAVPGSETISAGEQVVVQPGQAPGARRRLVGDQMGAVGGCLIDFHEATLAFDRQARLDAALDAAIQAALADASGPAVSLAVVPTSPFRPMESDLIYAIDNPLPAEQTQPTTAPVAARIGSDVEDQVSTGAADEAFMSIGSGGGLPGGEIPGTGDGNGTGGGLPGGGIPGVP